MTQQETRRLSETAAVITSEKQAIEAARAVAALAATDVVKRDSQRIYPQEALALFSSSGLGSILVPRHYGGGGLSYGTVAEVFRIISAVDPSLGQIPQNHFGLIQYLRDEGTELQKQQLFGRVVAGYRIGNGGPEKGARHTREVLARLHYTPEGPRLTGEKFYSTGALFADIAATTAIDDQGKHYWHLFRCLLRGCKSSTTGQVSVSEPRPAALCAYRRWPWTRTGWWRYQLPISLRCVVRCLS